MFQQANEDIGSRELVKTTIGFHKYLIKDNYTVFIYLQNAKRSGWYSLVNRSTSRYLSDCRTHSKIVSSACNLHGVIRYDVHECNISKCILRYNQERCSIHR